MKNLKYFLTLLLLMPLITMAQYKGGIGSGDGLSGISGKHLTNWFHTDGNWSSPGNWKDGLVPSVIEEANVLAAATLDANYTYPVVNIAPSGILTIPDGKNLTISGTLENNNGNAGVMLQSGSSLIHPNANVSGTMQRQVSNADWTQQIDGWHLLSSPVENQLLSNGGFTNAEYDFYSWRENTNEWLNQKVGSNNITAFEPGKGYLVAYDDGGTKEFAGKLNVNDIVLSGLSKTGSSFYSGYHLIGNPFTSALKWNDGNWALSNVSTVASVWNKSAQNYLSLAAPDDIIPSNQGFFIQVNDVSNNIKIPANARIHSTSIFYKETPVDFLKFRITNSVNETFDETSVRLNPDASAAYDPGFDGHKLTGGDIAPQLYTVIQPGENASVNTYAATDVPSVIEMGFRPGVDATYTMTAEEFTFSRQIVLEDKLTGVNRILESGFSYAFNGAIGDAENRFVLHFSPLGTPDLDVSTQIKVYTAGNSIYINSTSTVNGMVDINSVSGQTVYSGILSTGLTTINASDLAPGMYIVKVIAGRASTVQKIILQ